MKTSLILVILSVGLFLTGCSWERSSPADIFSLSQEKNIMRPENFGIANGKITTGIQCKDLFSIEGIWAPPYVSSDFSFHVSLNGHQIKNPSFKWFPFYIERNSDIGDSLVAKTNTLLIPEGRSLIQEFSLKSLKKEKMSLVMQFNINGTLDVLTDDASWGFQAPKSKTPVTVRVINSHTIALEQDRQSLIVCSDRNTEWDMAHNCFKLGTELSAGSEIRGYFTFSVGSGEEAMNESKSLAGNPGSVIFKSKRIYDQQVGELFKRLPELESDNLSLVAFYNRSLVPLLMNRWDVREFRLKPFYSTGSVRGGCIGDYLWNVGECYEILPMIDPVATKAHIRQFLETGVKHGFGFCPINGGMLHPNYFYPINQEKIIEMTYEYIRNTGDIAFLKEKLGNGTVIDSVISEALYLDDLSKPVSMIDYNVCDPQHRGGQSHLELRNRIGRLNYTNVMPDLNGRRYLNYILAARLSELAGYPSSDLLNRAGELKNELKKQLWRPDKKWFVFRIPDSIPQIEEARYTVQMFYLLGSGVLDAEEENGLLSHLNEKEFLSDYGLHSLAKQDPAYLQADVDNGGPGSCTCFPLNIAKTLYNIGKSQLADEILKRILWWGDRMPYWGDSFYADTIRYREETPLQSTIDACTGAQCIIFGMFGIHPEFDGSVTINPVLPSFASEISLKGVRFHNQTFDVFVKGSTYKVKIGGSIIESRIGEPLVLKAGKLFIKN